MLGECEVVIVVVVVLVLSVGPTDGGSVEGTPAINGVSALFVGDPPAEI